MPLLIPCLIAVCSPQPTITPEAAAPVLAALPGARHGHRLERLAGGWLCFGGFARKAAAGGGQRDTWFLPDGAPTWQPRADLRHPHAFFGSAVLDGVIYAIGDAVERYDPERDRWHVVVRPGALPQSHLAAAAHDGRIFVLGGFPERGTGFAAIDPSTGAVTELQPPPAFAHGDHFSVMASFAGDLHVVGGIGSTRAHRVLRDGQWHELPDLPADMWAKFGVSAILGERLFVFGEFGGWRYDGTPGSWHRLRDLPAMVAMPAACVANGDLWVLGGLEVSEQRQVLWRYEVDADRWLDLLEDRSRLAPARRDDARSLRHRRTNRHARALRASSRHESLGESTDSPAFSRGNPARNSRTWSDRHQRSPAASPSVAQAPSPDSS